MNNFYSDNVFYSADQIRNMLMSQAFYDWYQTKFDNYVLGEDGCATKDEINQDIEGML